MNKKVSQAFAASTAALMAASAVPSQATTGTNLNKQVKEKSVTDYIKGNPGHTVATATFALTTLGFGLYSAYLKSQTTDAKKMEFVKRMFEALPNGAQLTNYLFSLSGEGEKNALLTLTAYKDQEGTAGVGTSPADTFVAVDDGKEEGHLCSKGGLLDSLKGKVVRLDNLAAYMVVKSASKEEETKTETDPKETKKEKNTTDPADKDYKPPKLNDEQKLFAQATADIIFEKLQAEEQANQPKEQKDQQSQNIEKSTLDDDNQGSTGTQTPNQKSQQTSQVTQPETNEDQTNADERKKQLMKEIQEAEYANGNFKKLIKIKLTKEKDSGTITGTEEQKISEQYIQILAGDDNDEKDETTKQLLNDIFTWRGTVEQVVMHMYRELQGATALAEGQKYPEDVNKEEIKGYKKEMFNEGAVKAIDDLIAKIKEANNAAQTEQN